ncbi:hypothetical protein M2401_003828 [Pseudomonas sp. JUb42]|jgi:hypothetical protein|uniref:DUF748 domain-containing protein n=1 Tax=Pseudomonas sp. JUb42 TaxID=2940611 RepID=UPI002169233D|nr:DUF748 domain-containing protein [Pseudomonas sp. JUb42]MCS3470078.1 hypothetical protein [Pseudomonas sp. JUb42]
MKLRYRWPLVIFASLAVLLTLLNIALPFLVRDYLNDKLRDMDSYSGHVEDVDIALWRGAYAIKGLKVTKVDGKVPIPLLDVPHIDIAVSWHSLWYDHAVVATAGFLQPTLNFVDGGVNKQASQTGAGTNWRAQLEKLLPITLNEVRVEDGKITFNNFNSKPPVKLEASKIDASFYNLTNVQNPEGKRDARFEGKAVLFGQAPLDATAAFDPLSNFENFEFRLRVTNIELKRINDFASAYGKFDFNAGHGDVVIEAQASKGKLNGYIKPLLRDVDVLNWQQDVENKDKSLLRSVWEALVGGTETVLKNQRKNQFATRVELSGDVHRLDISPLQAFWEILRNGFIQAFSARYEQAPASKD